MGVYSPTPSAGRSTATGYGPVWGRARARLWPPGHALSKVRVYDLRHSAATMMLRAGVPAAEVARRLGHSVDVLMRVYAGVFEDERDRSNELIEARCPRGANLGGAVAPHDRRAWSIQASMSAGSKRMRWPHLM